MSRPRTKLCSAALPGLRYSLPHHCSPPLRCADGSPGATWQAHRGWGGGKNLDMRDWTHREGYGESPDYLEETRLSIEDENQQFPPHEPAMHLSNSSMRMLEHPLKWKQMRRARSAAALRAVGTQTSELRRSGTSSSLCCTYGLKPAFPRTGSAPMRRPASQASSLDGLDDAAYGDGGLRAQSRPQTAASLGRSVASGQGAWRPTTPVWRGTARPYPQDTQM